MGVVVIRFWILDFGFWIDATDESEWLSNKEKSVCYPQLKENKERATGNRGLG
jgi:hypothetical protein